MRDPIAQRVQEVTGLDQAAAGALSSAVIFALIEQLPARDRSAFVARLPASIARPPVAPLGSSSDYAAGFYERVSVLARIPVAHAIEVSQAVCSTLAGLLDVATRTWLGRRLPPAIGTLLVPRELPPHIPVSPQSSRRYPTLAEGRSGSSHPLSEASFDPAHQHSVARSENPHGDVKLSSAAGPTQVREHEALAEANPRAERPLSSGKQ